MSHFAAVLWQHWQVFLANFFKNEGFEQLPDLSKGTTTFAPESLHSESLHVTLLHSADFVNLIFISNCIVHDYNENRLKTQQIMAEKETKHPVRHQKITAGQVLHVISFKKNSDIHFSANPIFRSLPSRLKSKVLEIVFPFLPYYFYFLVNISDKP